jgi:hypothetical protein
MTPARDRWVGMYDAAYLRSGSHVTALRQATGFLAILDLWGTA